MVWKCWREQSFFYVFAHTTGRGLYILTLTKYLNVGSANAAQILCRKPAREDHVLADE